MSKLDEAKEFLRSRSLRATIDHPDIAQEFKNKFKHVNNYLDHFRRIGDLYVYINRFDKTNAERSPWELAIKNVGLDTLEDIHEDFVEQFSPYKNDRTRLEDFVVGETYSSWDVIIFAEMYDARSGGILPIGPEGNLDAVFIKATLDGSGRYPNEWIVQGEILKYYMKAIKGVYKTTYSVNAAIINSGDAPIYVFDKRGTDCTLVGLFSYQRYVTEPNGDMWFRLVKQGNFDHSNPIRSEELQGDLDREIEKSKTDTSEARQKRLQGANKRPRKRETVTTSFERNADVIVEVLERAGGVCERCENSAPFIRRKDNSPYLEVHHIETLADGGEDSVENALALCPNCHRELHFGVSN